MFEPFLHANMIQYKHDNGTMSNTARQEVLMQELDVKNVLQEREENGGKIALIITFLVLFHVPVPQDNKTFNTKK